MAAVLVYGLTLVAAVLVSRLAQRTILSAALLFLAVGFLVGDGVLGIVALSPGDAPVATLVEIALFSVLFTDGMQVGLRDVRSAWRLPGRALVLGLPLTLVVTALAAWLVVGLPGLNAVLVGAALSATDPVLAAPLVGHEAVPARLRHLLNVESALNDGLALPVVIVLLATLSAVPADTVALIGDAVLGTVLGVVVPWTLIRLERTRLFGAAPLYEPLLVFAIGVVLFAVGSLSHANLFLAAFTGGATVASVSPSMRRAFRHFGETLSEILKLAAILVFGALLSPRFFTEDPVAGYGFVTLALLLARPLALSIALIGTRLDRREWIAAAWFGPKGFASVVYGLLILNAGVAGAHRMFHLIALTTTASIVAHSSTDVLVVRWFRHAVDTPDKRKLA